MRYLSIILVVACTPALACNKEMISVDGDWSFEPVTLENGSVVTKVDYTYRYHGTLAFERIDGVILFADANDDPLAVFDLEEDAGLKPGEAHHVTFNYAGADTHERFAKVDREDVTANSCVRYIVYANGDLKTFR